MCRCRSRRAGRGIAQAGSGPHPSWGDGRQAVILETAGVFPGLGSALSRSRVPHALSCLLCSPTVRGHPQLRVLLASWYWPSTFANRAGRVTTVPPHIPLSCQPQAQRVLLAGAQLGPPCILPWPGLRFCSIHTGRPECWAGHLQHGGKMRWLLRPGAWEQGVWEGEARNQSHVPR